MWNIKGLACCILVLHLAKVGRPYRLQDAATAAQNFLDDSDADADDDLDDDGYGGRQRHTPVRTPDFVTLGQKYSVAIGSTIVLPCKINDSELFEHYVLAWKRDIAVLTAGNVKVTMNPRIRLMPHKQQPQAATSSSSGSGSHKGGAGGGNNYNLEIQNVRGSDAGEYACQVGTLVPKEIVHRLEVLVPPKITFLSPTNKLEVSKGTSIKLECRATGNPQPLITWTRKNNVMPNGEANITNNVLEMLHADRHTVGHYKCTADNRVGQPDQRDVSVNVLYAPEIEVERPFVHTGLGHETQLVCIVHAEPAPHVIWYKGSTQLGVTEQHSQQNRGNRYALNIRNVTVADLGNYTCQASNQLGKDREGLTVSGIPSICEIVESPRVSNYHDQYNISWTVESYEPIFEYRLYYRQQTNASNRMPYVKLIREKNAGTDTNGNVGRHGYQATHVASPVQHEHQADWRDITIVPQPAYGSSSGYSGSHYRPSSSGGGLDQHLLHGSSASSSGLSSYGSTRQHVISHSPWNANGHQKMSYMMVNLRTAANYEVRVQARNVHGWNRLSSTFHFSTADFVVDDNTIPVGGDFRPLTLQSSSTSAAVRHVVSIAAVLATSLTFFCTAFCMQTLSSQQHHHQQQQQHQRRLTR